jgi:hypothetical protein
MKTLILDAVTKSITAVMAGAAATTNPDFTSHYADVTATAFTEAANDGVFNGTTPVTPVAAPAAATRRVIKCITIQNRDTAAVVITLNYVSAGGTRQLWKGTLAVGDTFTLDGSYDNNGNLKTVIYAAGLVTTQHTHAKLVSSNAAVDPALSADAAGALTAAIAPFTLTGGQLKFPATQNASADANTLDDYEEGTWTAAMTCGTSGTITINAATGAYTKIGRTVTVTGALSITSVSSPVGAWNITGLPFTVATGAQFTAAAALLLDGLEVGAITSMMARTSAGSSQITIYRYAAGALDNGAAHAKAAAAINISCTYFAA